MREGWEIKKLGEVCKTFTDGDWIESKDQANSGIRLIQTGNIGNGIFKDKDEHYKFISNDTFEELSCTEIFEGDILISRLPEPIGRACIIPSIKCRMITAVDCTIVRPNESILPKYLIYYTRSKEYYNNIKTYITGAVRKRISRANLAKVSVPIPPLPEQQKIVEELECVSKMIELKKKQLETYDKLAQSIFYDMFGDPITNEKGWPTCKVIQVVTMQRGYDLPVQNRNIDGLIPVYGSNGIVGYHDTEKVKNGIITGRSGTLGKVYSMTTPFWPLNTTLFSIDTHDNNITFLKYLITNYKLERYRAGAGVPTLNRNNFHNDTIISIPLSLQQQFAEKIEAIEKQKELIKQTLKSLEELFNSRMDYYFN